MNYGILLAIYGAAVLMCIYGSLYALEIAVARRNRTVNWRRLKINFGAALGATGFVALIISYVSLWHV